MFSENKVYLILRHEAGPDDDSRVSQAVGEGIHRPLPALGGEEHRRLRDLTSTAGVGGQALGHQVLPRHPEVHRILNVNLPVGVALGDAATYRNLNRQSGTINNVTESQRRRHAVPLGAHSLP